ncbi:hypothetical protein JCM8115_002971 [Rhodotorula mucilaginosa]
MSASQPPSAASTSALASGVASRFVSADALEQAKQKRAEEWKEAYKRLGQEPPPELVAEDEAYDPRSLYERLQENKSKKQEAFEEQLKFKNHFRALDEEEISFLDSIVDDNNDEERERKKAIQDELRAFKQAVTKRSAAPPPPILAGSSSSSLLPAATASISPPLASSTSPPIASTTKAPATKPTGGKGGKKRKLLPGVVVPPKKPRTASNPSPSPAASASKPSSTAAEAVGGPGTGKGIETTMPSTGAAGGKEVGQESKEGGEKLEEKKPTTVATEAATTTTTPAKDQEP